MKILFVEDHELFAESVSQRLRSLPHVAAVLHARARDEAIALLRANFVDLLILDLSILEKEGEIIPDTCFGRDVFAFAQSNAPGLPTYLLTTSEPDDALMGLMREGDRYDIWGEQRDVAAVGYYQKERSIDQLIADVQRIAATVAALDAITVDTRGRSLGLNEGYLRAIKVFTRQRGGDVIELKPLDGGKSRASVMHGLVKNSNDHVIASTVIKIGARPAIEQETNAFDRHVVNLPNGSFTPKLSTVLKGTCGSGAVVYSLAETFTQDMFRMLMRDPGLAQGAVSDVAGAMRRWSDAGRISETPIAVLRARLLWDEDFHRAMQKYGLNLSDVEALPVRHRAGCIHADLHGGNILIEESGRPIIIDFGEVGEGASALDPISLDLSIYFHPDAVRDGLRAKADHALESWTDPDVYLACHPFPGYAKACRDWAYDVAGGDRAVLACAYAYLVRQLKFNAVDHTSTVTLIHDIAQRLRGL
ncbi:phosphotransferase [Sphingomonas solaris]|uniref:Phosphotransferase n=1 Tax=Alterirhizorhabdus solaris TaxID=2529389 RepID=A0A558R9S3_9SPHN|nr:phosphotransferase [Sphingomonas solaris]TVV76032.1 phosphotransferase [Sphingomonas solaris]